MQLAIACMIGSGLSKALSAACMEWRVVAFADVQLRLQRRVCLFAYRHLLDLEVLFHQRRQSGTLAKVVDRGCSAAAMLLRTLLITLLPTLAELALVCFALSQLVDPVVLIPILVTFVAYAAWTAHWTSQIVRGRREANDLDSRISGTMMDTLANHETVTAFHCAAEEERRLDGLMLAAQIASSRLSRMSGAQGTGQSIILAVGVTIIFCLLAWRGQHRGASFVGDLVMTNGILQQLWLPLQFLGFFFSQLRQGLVDLDALTDLLDRPSAVASGTKALAPAGTSSGGGAPAEPFGLSVAFEGVRYDSSDGKEVLADITGTLPAGQSLGVVGSSGSGKSTLLRLLWRAADPSAGVVRIAGHDARDLDLSSLRSATAVVSQEPVLFHGTLAENILYGCPGATEADALDAATSAGLGPLLQRLEKGLGSLVGERGASLSGGERQRVAIARAMLRKPRLLLCDEVTASLDAMSEVQVLAALAAATRGCTSLFVAHRLSSVAACDAIWVVDDGRVVEAGSHEALLELGGHYARLWQQQQQQQKPSS